MNALPLVSIGSNGADVAGHHLSPTLAYAIVAVFAVFFVIGIVKKIIALAVVAAIVAVLVALYHQGTLNGIVGSG